MSDDTEFDTLPLTERSVARFLSKYRIGNTVPYRVIYQVYISSPEWRERKAAYFSTHAKRCESCDTDENIHLHHKTYVRFTQELDDDLAAVCETCHQWIHHLHRSSKLTLAAATDAILSAGRREALPTPTKKPKLYRGRATSAEVGIASVRKRQRKESPKVGSWRGTADKLRAVEAFKRQYFGDA